MFATIEDSEYRADKIDCNLIPKKKMLFYKKKMIFFLDWDDVYGFDFSAIKPMAMLEPLVDVAEPNQLVCVLLAGKLKSIFFKNKSKPFSSYHRHQISLKQLRLTSAQ